MSGSTTSVPRPSFTDAGFVAPAEQDVLTGALADIDAAMGGGTNPALETPQGQLASSLTAIIADKNDQFVLLSQACDPALSSGRMQDGIGRIYFIDRNPALPTTVQALCSGTTNVQIPTGALALALDGNIYSCVQGGSIDITGFVTLSFACLVTGPIPCPATSLSTIYRTIVGWDSITNPTDGVLGNDEETRREFESRRQQSLAKNAVGSIPAVQGSVLSVPNILDAYTIDNPTGTPVTLDGVVLPPNSLYVCVAGGDPAAVATAVWKKKMPGCAMAGNTTQTVMDNNSLYSPPYPSYNITFQTAIPQSFVYIIRITNSSLVPSNSLTQIQGVILNAFAGIDGGPRARIGSTVYASRYYSGVAQLGAWAEIVSIKIGSTGSPKAVFAASISGTVMTVTALSAGVIGIGHTISGTGIPNNVVIVSFGTGSGGTGTYNISLPQTIATEQIVSILADLDIVSVGIAHVPVLSAADVVVVLV